MGVHYKAGSRRFCKDMATYYKGIVNVCKVAFFDGVEKVLREQGVEDVGNMGKLWVKNVCFWVPPRHGQEH